MSASPPRSVSRVHVIDYVIVIGWVVFWIYWFMAAADAKSGQRRAGQYVGVRFAIVPLMLLLLRLKAVREHEVTLAPWLQGTGFALFLLGLALAVWARLYLGRNWGSPMTEKDDPELVRTGPYRTIRHPIYSGVILALTGTALATSVYWLIAVLVLVGYFTYSAIIEERTMARRFPDDYPTYKRSTKMLIPYIF